MLVEGCGADAEAEGGGRERRGCSSGRGRGRRGWHHQRRRPWASGWCSSRSARACSAEGGGLVHGGGGGGSDLEATFQEAWWPAGVSAVVLAAVHAGLRQLVLGATGEERLWLQPPDPVIAD